MQQNTWGPCPRCNSNRVRMDSLGSFFLWFGIALAALGFVFVLTPFIGAPIFLLGILLVIYGGVKKRKNKNLLRCLDCHNTWIYQASQAN